MLWYEIREWKNLGHYFRRQVPIGDFVVDFACLKAKLVIELDGEQHAEKDAAEKDKVRDRILRQQGFQVVRVWNGELYNNTAAVLDAIWNLLPLGGEVSPKATVGVEIKPNQRKHNP